MVLYEKFYATIAATRIASAMGAVVECWSIDQIEEKYGVLERLDSYEHYNTGWKRVPGTTEDGIERQKLMCGAIMDKQDRITAADLIAWWRKVLDPEKMPFMTEGFDVQLFQIAQSGLVPANELGRFCPHFHINTTGRSFHAIPLINAGDLAGMMEDLYEIGGVYQHPNSLAFPWGKVYNAAMVEALTPGATPDSVLEAGMKFADAGMREQIGQVLAIAGKYDDPLDMRREVNRLYDNRSGSYPLSWIDENVTKSLAIFHKCHGDVRSAIITGVNFGRDTDCTAASAAGLAAAFAGPETIPSRWIEEVDAATRENPYTNSRLTIKETAEGMIEAYRGKVDKLVARVAVMENLIRPEPKGLS